MSKENKKLVSSINDIAKENIVVKNAVAVLLKLSKPEKDVVTYLDKIGELNEAGLDKLEEYISVFTAWQNYFQNQLIKADAIKTVAEQQKDYMYSLAIEQAVGTVNLKKDLAKNNAEYNDALSVYHQAKYIYESYVAKFDMCERGFRLVSRILTKRLNIKLE